MARPWAAQCAESMCCGRRGVRAPRTGCGLSSIVCGVRATCCMGRGVWGYRGTVPTVALHP